MPPGARLEKRKAVGALHDLKNGCPSSATLFVMFLGSVPSAFIMKISRFVFEPRSVETRIWSC